MTRQRKTTKQLGKMPPKSTTAKYEIVKGVKCRRIPCNNPWQYTGDLAPIYETMRITRGEITDFECITTHKVKAQLIGVSENDNLYSIFAQRIGESIASIRQWLKFFVLMNKKNLNLRATAYMASKGLNFDTWLGSIDDGHKGDVFTLFYLCMLQDVHATIHFRNGKYWTSMNEPSCDHYINMERSHIHLAYLGCGLYIELVKRDIPLQIITGASKDLIVLGTLESEERSILDSALNQGLGIALDHTTRVGTPQHVQVKTEPSLIPLISPKPTTSSDPNVSPEPSTSTTPSEKVNIQATIRGKSHLVKAQSQASVTKLHKSLRISINKMDIQEGVRVNVTTDMLAKCPISVLHDESSTEGYVSTETEIYWPISPKPVKASKISEGAIPDKTDKPTSKQRDSKFGRDSLQSKQSKKRMIYAKPSQFMFRICTIGIKKKKPKYYFKCVAENCSKTFDKLQTWNTHH